MTSSSRVTNAFRGLRRFLSDPPVAALIVVMAVAVAWTLVSRVPATAQQAPSAMPRPRNGFYAPDFTLITLDGADFTLSSVRGHPVLLNFWASWCLPCQMEMPALQRVYEQHRKDGLLVVGANVTAQDSESDARDFVLQHGLSFPIALDRDGATRDRYELMGLPSTYFIDRQGIIRDVLVGGPMSEALILSKIEHLLDEP